MRVFQSTLSVLQITTILFLVGSILFSCEEEVQTEIAPNALIGTWKYQESGTEHWQVFTFSEDFTGVYATSSGEQIAFSYVFTKTSVTIAGGMLTGSYTYEMPTESELKIRDQLFSKQ